MIKEEDIAVIYQQPMLQLITKAREIHQKNFSDEIELCQLISIKTGGCPEDCGYCSQSIYNNSEIKLNALLPIEEIRSTVIEAKKNGVKRICMGAAYKSPNTSSLKRITEYIKLIKEYELETCATLGNLSTEQANQLKDAGLDYYNHNIDSSPEYYKQIVTTHSFQDRLDTINNVGNAGIKVCCGGIMGMGESTDDRIKFIFALTQLSHEPTSIPINTLVKIAGTKLSNVEDLDKLELIRVIATIRILFPRSKIRLSAGRNTLNDIEQTMCFMSGANSIFFGDKLLTADNNNQYADKVLLDKLGVNIQTH